MMKMICKSNPGILNKEMVKLFRLVKALQLLMIRKIEN